MQMPVNMESEQSNSQETVSLFRLSSQNHHGCREARGLALSSGPGSPCQELVDFRQII